MFVRFNNIFTYWIQKLDKSKQVTKEIKVEETNGKNTLVAFPDKTDRKDTVVILNIPGIITSSQDRETTKR